MSSHTVLPLHALPSFSCYVPLGVPTSLMSPLTGTAIGSAMFAISPLTVRLYNWLVMLSHGMFSLVVSPLARCPSPTSHYPFPSHTTPFPLRSTPSLAVAPLAYTHDVLSLGTASTSVPALRTHLSHSTPFLWYFHWLASTVMCSHICASHMVLAFAQYILSRGISYLVVPLPPSRGTPTPRRYLPLAPITS